MFHNRTRTMSKKLLKSAKRQATLWDEFEYLEDNNLTDGKRFKFVAWALICRIREGRKLRREIHAGL